jgi:hypothetical protein
MVREAQESDDTRVSNSTMIFFKKKSTEVVDFTFLWVILNHGMNWCTYPALPANPFKVAVRD